MKNKTTLFLLIVIIVILFIGLLTTERERQDFWREAKWAVISSIKSNPNIPKIETVPVYGQGECNSYKINPDYKEYIETHPKKEIDIEECVKAKKLGKELESIARINCRAKAVLPDPYAPQAVLPAKISCQRIVGYDKVLNLYGISWFKVEYETNITPQFTNNTISCSDGKFIISTDKVIATVRELPEVKSYIQLFSSKQSKPIIEVDNIEDKEGKNWSVHVYENVNDSSTSHTTTFNWYTIDKCTGSIKCSFSKYDKQGNLTGVSSESEYPCK